MRMGHRPISRAGAEDWPPMTDASAALRAYVFEDVPDIPALEADLLREMGFGLVTCTRIVELAT